MKIAVLMSTFNGEKYLKEQIDSILNQEGDFQLDLWVRDDGSTDNTTLILDEFQGKNKLKWYKGENLGPGLSFLEMVKNAIGYDYYAFADQDDIWKKDKIDRAIIELRDKEIPYVYCGNAELVDEALHSFGRLVYRTPPRTDFHTVSCAGGILGCTMVFNHSLAKIIQDVALPANVVMHDFYLCELCLALGGKLIYDNSPVLLYRQHEKNVVGVSTNKIVALKERIRSVRIKAKVSISVQAEQILVLYDNNIPLTNKKWLFKVSRYPEKIFNRISLAVSHKTKYSTLNNAVKNRIAIALGNR